MTGNRSIIRQLVTWIVAANTILVVGWAAFYLWRGYETRGNETADKLEHLAQNLVRATVRTPAGLQMPDWVATNPEIHAAAILVPKTGEIGRGSDLALIEAIEPAIQRGLTESTMILELPGQERLNVVVASAETAEGLRTAIVAHRGELHSELLEWVLHELAADVLPIFAPLLLSTLALSIIIIGRGLAPVRALAHQAASLSPNALDLRLPTINIPQEVAPLIRSLNAALGRVEVGFRSQQRFTANAAHELRTPLAILKARCDALGDTPLREAVMRDMDRMATIIDQLLSIARIEARQIPLDEDVDLAETAMSTIADLFPLAHAKGRDIAFEQTDSPLPLRGNTVLMHGALRNVIENALRLTPSGSIVEVRLDPGPTLLVLDRGPGVPQDQKRAIFEPFFRGSGTRSGGAGLGLAIAAEATRLHGGQLSAHDREGGGACFTFDFAAPHAM